MLLEYFKFRCYKALRNKNLDHLQEYKDRLEHEIDVINKLSFLNYILIVADYINYARENNILVGFGRGSAAASLACYLLGITYIDPMKYKDFLVFERFLDADRISPCDIDYDVSDKDRHKILEYIAFKYGKDNVCSIGTLGSLKSKAAVRDVARVLGFTYDIGDKISKLLLDPIDGKPIPIIQCYDKVPQLKEWREDSNNLIEGKILYWAEKFENSFKSFGTHAGGRIITSDKVSKYIPLFSGVDNQPTSQLDMNSVEELGFIKFDILGLKTLTTIQTCLSLIKDNVNIYELEPNDINVYNKLHTGDCLGIFQLETSQGIKDLLVKFKPENIDDLALLVSLFRPGPISSGMLDECVAVKNKVKPAEYLVPELKDTLSKTYSIMAYQEQIMTIARDIAGYTMAESDSLRRACAKKKPKLMDKHEIKFISGVVSKGYTKNVGNILWNQIKGNAAYMFNAAHAYAYSMLTYVTAYLKTYYPTEYLCSCLMVDSNEQDKVIKYINNCKENFIEIKPPSINKSNLDFTISKNKEIKFGLIAITNVGNSIKEVISERDNNGEFKNIKDFCNRVNLTKINKRKLECLILSGAFDDFGYTRSSLLNYVEQLLEYKEEQKKYLSKLETYIDKFKSYNEREEEIEKWNADQAILSNLIATKRIKKCPIKSFKLPIKPIEVIEPEVKFLPELDILTILTNEKELLGYYFSGHPLDYIDKKSLPFKTKISSIQKIKEPSESKGYLNILSIPSVIKEVTSKKSKQKMAHIILEDKTDTIQASIYYKSYSKYKDLINVNKPAIFSGFVECTKNDDEDDEGIYKFSIINIIPIKMLETVIDTNKIDISCSVDNIKDKEYLNELTKNKDNINLKVNLNNFIAEFRKRK